MLDEGKIEHTKAGTHRRVLVSELLSYKEKADAARNKSLDTLSELSQELDGVLVWAHFQWCLMTVEEFIDCLYKQQLPQTASVLTGYKDLI